jgi:DNA-binding response OmpR family regulator
MENKRRLLVVEDDEPLRAALVEHLSEHGFVVQQAATLAEADVTIQDKNQRLDAIILDLSLPDGDGCDFCATLRKAKLDLPIIMLTGSGGEADVIRGLAAGANDYVGKPFRIGELIARLHSQIRSFDSSGQAVVDVGVFEFLPAKKLLRNRSDKRSVRLTNKEVSVLRFLYRADADVDRGVLLAEVWGYNSGVSSHTIETHIYRLRQKIEADPANPAVLVTTRKGYRLRRGSEAAAQAAQNLNK